MLSRYFCVFVCVFSLFFFGAFSCDFRFFPGFCDHLLRFFVCFVDIDVCSGSHFPRPLVMFLITLWSFLPSRRLLPLPAGFRAGSLISCLVLLPPGRPSFRCLRLLCFCSAAFFLLCLLVRDWSIFSRVFVIGILWCPSFFGWFSGFWAVRRLFVGDCGPPLRCPGASRRWVFRVPHGNRHGESRPFAAVLFLLGVGREVQFYNVCGSVFSSAFCSLLIYVLCCSLSSLC